MTRVLRFAMPALAGLLIGALLRPDPVSPDGTVATDQWEPWQSPDMNRAVVQLANDYRQRPFWGSGPEPDPAQGVEKQPDELPELPPDGTLLAWRFLGTASSPNESTAWLVLEQPEGEQVISVQPGEQLQDGSLITAVESARITYMPNPNAPDATTQTRYLYEDSP